MMIKRSKKKGGETLASDWENIDEGKFVQFPGSGLIGVSAFVLFCFVLFNLPDLTTSFIIFKPLLARQEKKHVMQ